MPKPERVLYCGTFASLEQRLFERLDEATAGARTLAPVAVVVPNQMLSLHLRRTYAQRVGCHANVHFLTLHSLVTRLIARRVSREGLAPEPSIGLRLALARALETGADLRYFSQVATQEGFQRAAIQTIEDLVDAGITPDTLDEALGAIREKDPFLSTKLADVLHIWRKMEDIRRANRFYDPRGQAISMAIAEAGQSSFLRGLAAFFLYGFYDFTGLQRRFLATCFALARSEVFMPYLPQRAFEYARPGLEWLESLGFRRTDLRVIPAGDSALRRLQTAIFSERGGDTGEPADSADLLIISAPGETREVEEIVREVVHSPIARNGGAATFGVLLRSVDPYLDLLNEALSALSVSGDRAPGSFHPGPCLLRTRSGRSLLLLASLLDRRFRRADVMDFLLSADLRPLEGQADPPPVALWNHMTLAAGIVEGKHEWLTRLESLAAESTGETPRSPRHRHRQPWSDADVLCFRNFISHLFDDLEQVARNESWRGLCDSLKDLFGRLVRDDSDSGAVIESLQEIASLDGLVGAPSIAEFRKALEEVLGSTRERSGDFGRAEPTVGDLMQARGVPFDVVILPGLVEKLFPRPARPDPIMLDEERRLVSGVLRNRGHDIEIPEKSRRRAEERLLFALAAQAARQRLVLTFPRLRAEQGRPNLPSHFLLYAVEAVTGAACDFDRLDRVIRDSSLGRFVPLSRLDPNIRSHAVTALEYDLSSAGKAQAEANADALAYLFFESPFFAAARTAEVARYATRRFTEYDGAIAPGPLPQKIACTLLDPDAAVSPTSLEDYAKCPFSYLLKHVFGLEPLEEPERVAVISPMDRGRLVHEILCDFVGQVISSEKRPLGPDLLRDLERTAERWFETFPRMNVVGFPLTWTLAKEELLEDLRGFLRAESILSGPFVPAYVEVRFGGRGEHPIVLKLEDGEVVRFSGRMDRVDLDLRRKRSLILDYKTGSEENRIRDGEFAGGQALQLPLYLVAAEQLWPDFQPEAAAYYHVSRRASFKRFPFTTEGWEGKLRTLKGIVSTICHQIRAGRFYPCGNRKCEYCRGGAMPSDERFDNFKWYEPDDLARSFREMTRIP